VTISNVQKTPGSQLQHSNGVPNAFCRCLKCCFWCLEKFIKFINRNAYIMVRNMVLFLVFCWT